MLEAAADEELEGDEDDRDGLVPYAPDFTPASLGKKIGEANVLTWLLRRASSGPKSELQQAIADTCLRHIDDVKNRRDMASHVVRGLVNYQLVVIDEVENVALSNAGASILDAPANKRDEAFARHILTMCNGYRLVEAIHRIELAGQPVRMEVLTEELDRHSTSKSISTMKAWLERAGVMERGKRYVVNDAKVEELLGRGTLALLGLDPREVEFLLAARVQQAMTKEQVLEAADVKALAEMRRPDVKLPSKGLASFARGLVQRGLIVEEKKAKAKGGARFAFRLSKTGAELTDDQVRNLVAQAGSGMPLEKLLPLGDAVSRLATGSAEERGHLGEMVAVHGCLLLGLRVVAWRQRAPVEIDLTAERTTGLSYQRWHVQVKNIEGDLDADRVDREIGAAAGTGATHLLFVVPRGKITGPARLEIDSKSKLTHLHIYVLSTEAFALPLDSTALVTMLRSQEAKLTRIKRMEAERRDRHA